MPGMTWRRKNFSPLMPSGARKIEQGLPSICGNNHSPTASKYAARSRFVTGTPSPASGQSTLSGLVMAIPKTVTVAELVKRDDPWGARPSFLAIGLDISASAFLSRSGVSVREVSVSTETSRTETPDRDKNADAEMSKPMARNDGRAPQGSSRLTSSATVTVLGIAITKPDKVLWLSLIHISEPTRRTPISYAVFCLKKKKTNNT